MILGMSAFVYRWEYATDSENQNRKIIFFSKNIFSSFSNFGLLCKSDYNISLSKKSLSKKSTNIKNIENV